MVLDALEVASLRIQSSSSTVGRKIFALQSLFFNKVDLISILDVLKTAQRACMSLIIHEGPTMVFLSHFIIGS